MWGVILHSFAGVVVGLGGGEKEVISNLRIEKEAVSFSGAILRRGRVDLADLVSGDPS